MTEPLWRPSENRVLESNLHRFMEEVDGDWNVTIDGFERLYAFSVDEREKFWQSVKDFTGAIAETWGTVVLEDGDRMPGARWFPGARLNFAENLLRRRDAADAIVFRGEDRVRRRLSHADLHAEVSRLAQALRAAGVTTGDRVAGYLPNMPEAVIAMLAATSIGAVWSSCSPDFGVEGVVDRFGQIEPKVLFAADGYFYNGKALDCLGKLAEVLKRLPSVQRTVIVPYTGEALAPGGLAGALPWAEFVGDFEAGEIAFERLPFDHPVYIMYSSGTTGVPKCIVHGAGGTLLQHLKEHQLHCDIRPNDRVFYFTTCGWMMWNWLVSALASQATLLLYDGSPFHPSGNVLFDYADAEGMTLFGTSAKYIDALAKAGLEPMRTHRLEELRTLTSTGSPLAPESFDYVYRSIKRDLHLASIAGGTDLISCFMLGNPMAPVWRGEIQTRGLGMAVEVFDDDGRPIRGEKGELVCTRPFPSMPVGFWNDPDGSRYHAAYFERFPGVWHHGDYVELTGARRDRHLWALRRHPQPRRRAHRHLGDLPAGGAARRGGGVHRRRPGLGRRCPGGAVRGAAPGDRPRSGSGGPHQAAHPRPLQSPARAGQGHPGGGHPAHQERQDHRAGGSRRDPRPGGEEHRGAGQPAGAGAVPGPAGVAVIAVAPARRMTVRFRPRPGTRRSPPAPIARTP